MDINAKVCPVCAFLAQQHYDYCPNCGASIMKTTVKFLTLEDELPDPDESLIARLRDELKHSYVFSAGLFLVGCMCFAIITPLGIADFLAYHLPSMPLLVYITQSVLHEPLKEVPFNSFAAFYIAFFLIFTPISVFVFWVYE